MDKMHHETRAANGEKQMSKVNPVDMAWREHPPSDPEPNYRVPCARPWHLSEHDRLLFEDQVKRVLELPPEHRTFGLIPMGYPRSGFGPASRDVLTEVVAIDRFGTRPSWSIQ
jgi:hypothetical protein